LHQMMLASCSNFRDIGHGSRRRWQRGLATAGRWPTGAAQECSCQVKSPAHRPDFPGLWPGRPGTMAPAAGSRFARNGAVSGVRPRRSLRTIGGSAGPSPPGYCFAGDCGCARLEEAWVKAAHHPSCADRRADGAAPRLTPQRAPVTGQRTLAHPQ
jgi:hypothetical protein